MISQASNGRLGAGILEQASTWFVEVSEGNLDAHARDELIRWLRTSPEHVRAYLQVAALWEDAALLDKDRNEDRDELIAKALAEANVTSIGEFVRLNQEDTASNPTNAETAGSRRLLAVAASVVVAVLGGGLFAWHQFYYAPTYMTDIGEQRSIRLTDGSMVELNARSKVRIRFSEAERAVELVEGQGLFRVAKDAARSFVVRSNGTEVRAVGTVFDVYRRESDTTVTVIEGSVAVVSPLLRDPRTDGSAVAPTRAPPYKPMILTAGEQLTIAPESAAQPVQADVAVATAWTQRQLVFQRASLTEVVEEFNRYNPRQMVILDPGLADTRISGVFSSTDPASLVLFLRGLPEFSIQETATEIRIARK